MRLDSIPSGTRVFIDANIFIYHFTGVSTQCSDFLNRCERSDLEGNTSANVLLEVLHLSFLKIHFAKNRWDKVSEIRSPGIFRR